MVKVKLLLKVLHLCMENFLKTVIPPKKLILKWKFFMTKSLSKLLRKVMVRSHPNTRHALERLQMRRQEVEGEGSTVNISQEEMSVEILGARSGYLRGYGVGPKPSSPRRAIASSRMEVQVLTNQVDTLKDVCQMQEKQIESLKNLCQNQEEKISTYDSQFETQIQLMANQAKKIEHLEMFMCQYLQGDRGGSNSS